MKKAIAFLFFFLMYLAFCWGVPLLYPKDPYFIDVLIMHGTIVLAVGLSGVMVWCLWQFFG